MNRKLWLLMMLFFSASVFAQKSSVKGVIIDLETGNPISGVKVSLKDKNLSVVSSKDGAFVFKNLSSGADELSILASTYQLYRQSLLIGKNEKINLGNIALIKAAVVMSKQEESTQLFDESMMDDDDNTSTQSSSYLSGASDDVYLKAASYNFSPMRFNLRGYDQSAQSTYINGVNFNDQERGRFNYSSFGGLNDAFRNKDIVNGIESSSFTYGDLGGVTNINTRASAYAAGTKAAIAYSNRSYTLRGTATYATGLMNNGWAFTASAAYRWANNGIVDGTFYNSFGYFLSAEKVINEHHRLSLMTFGAPTSRAQSAAVTQEVYDLAGSIYYNPYWGYQDGEKRNSRVVKSYDPTAIFNWDFKINEKQDLKTGLGFHYSNYSNSAIGFYNAPDPRPDYYRNLPSYQFTSQADPKNVDMGMFNFITDQWNNNNTNVTQVDWNALYQANYRLNASDPKASAKYMVERRHNNLMQSTLNSVYSNRISKKLKLDAGIGLNYSRGMHYKTVDDLLGANQWIDIDQFSERDFANDQTIIQNDVRNPNRVVKDGDKFGYDYNMNIIKGNAFVANTWNLNMFDINYAAQVTYTTFQRDGLMENGRAVTQGVKSYGKGKSMYFLDPSFKFGAVYKISGHHRLSFNALAETRAPYAGYAYVAPRIKDTRIKGLKQEKVFSGDLNYMFTTSVVQGRLTGFYTYVADETESLGYYDDGYRTFINHTLSGVDKAYRGVEAGINVKLNSSFSVALAGTYSDCRYMNNAMGTMSAESGIVLKTGELPTTPEEARNADITELVYTKDLKVNNGPQLAGSLSLDYFHPKMWFADITLNYFDNNYLSFAPSRFTRSNYESYSKEEKRALGVQEKLKNGFLLDASVGKVVYLNHRKQSLNINISLSNLLNNTDMITGGYQQGRISRDSKTKGIDSVNKFPNKYYYAWGFNCFVNIGYKF
ncbi:MAG: carboxypeptidase-like regulatory domain-containing protein [Bacteroides sp.]